MNANQWAKSLHRSQYRKVLNREKRKRLKADGVVIVYGDSDDRVEFHGALNEIHGTWPPDKIWLDQKGSVPRFDELDWECDEDVLRWAKRRENSTSLRIMRGQYMFNFSIDIPYFKFFILESCIANYIGIAFSLQDLPPTK